jgi:hypothetical protein
VATSFDMARPSYLRETAWALRAGQGLTDDELAERLALRRSTIRLLREAAGKRSRPTRPS